MIPDEVLLPEYIEFQQGYKTFRVYPAEFGGKAEEVGNGE